MKKGPKGLGKRTRNFVAFLASLLVLGCLAGCENGGGASTSETGQSQTENAGGSSGEASTQESIENPVDGDGESQKPDSKDLYLAFLKGEERVYCDMRDYKFYDSVADEEFDYFGDKNGYTLKDFIRCIQDVENLEPDYDIRIANVYYSMLDCGNDGEPELGLMVVTEGDLWGEGSDYQFVIKNFDGKLQLCDRLTSYYRSDNSLINHYGFLSDGYYWGMGNACTYYYLDAKGDEQYLYGRVAEYAPYSYDDEGGLSAAVAEIIERENDEALFDCVDFIEYRFKPYEDNENEEEVLKHSYEYYGGESEGIPADLKAFIEEAYQKAGIKLYTEAEIDGFIQEKMKSLGIGDKEVSYEDDDFEWNLIEREEFWPGKVVTVKDAAGLMGAIEDNAMIKLEPGTYDLTQWLTSGNNLSTVPQYWGGDYSSENPTGVLFTGWDEDSYEITINQIRNLVITSADPENPARVVCDCIAAKVLYFVNCGFVELDHLILGHEVQPGICSGDVIGFYNSFFIQVRNCDLYGCGAHAIDIAQSHDVSVNDSVIHDCTYGCMTMYDPGYVVISNTRFENCREYDMFEVCNGSVYFDNCSFKNLEGNMISMDDGSYVTFSGCQFDVNALESLQKNKRYDNQIVIY